MEPSLTVAEVLTAEELALTAKELAEIQRAWEVETLRIARELDEGRMGRMPWEEVRAEVFGRDEDE
ncbi:MAG TPA: hypothetical protein VIK91_09655 [Nannocystis sp.]